VDLKKRALITGITGQDGSYLAEFLLAQGYDVFGLVRRTSTLNFERIRHIQDQVTLISGDMLDQTSLTGAMNEIQPNEVYNLAAQSFVQTSWSQPVFTGDVTALGVTRLLDAIRTVNPEIRFYQASSSEMFGKVQEVPQTERTPFYPRSPYGVAKVYGHWITVNYRESYNMHATSGILFNHESVTSETPVFIRRDGLIDLVPIEDIVPHRTDPHAAPRYTTDVKSDEGFEIWDANGWSTVTCMTAYWNGYEKKPNKPVHRIAARGAVYQATGDHIVFACDEGRPVEKPASTVRQGDSLALIGLPETTNVISMTEDEAWLLGMLAAEGSVKSTNSIQVTNQDQVLLDEVASCWRRVCGGGTSRYTHPSGFKNGRDVTQLRLNGAGSYATYLRESLYTRSGDKCIPKRILNAPYESRLAFLRGFHAGDGLKRANGIYEFKGFKTASAVMAAGLYWLALNTLNQRAIICLEDRDGRLYYQINLNSPGGKGQKGLHLRRPLEEVVKTSTVEYRGWLFDLATATGTFHAGVGQGWIHNSPRRGLEFVTRKVSYNTAKIKLGLANELRMGNLDAQRDWGFAGDYVKAMWLMLQQDKPDDYVIATGVTHSVERLLDVAFSSVDLDWKSYIVQDERFMRPAEVDLLVGDASKAGKALGWEPAVSFEQLIQMMVEADMQLLKEQQRP
jgi:GDPmannose 4,6-dehydratase